MSFGSDWGVVSVVIARLYGAVEGSESGEGGSKSGGAIVVETGLSGGSGEDDDSDVSVAEDGELAGLLEKAVLALGESDLTVALVGYTSDLDLFATHGEELRLKMGEDAE